MRRFESLCQLCPDVHLVADELRILAVARELKVCDSFKVLPLGPSLAENRRRGATSVPTTTERFGKFDNEAGYRSEATVHHFR